MALLRRLECGFVTGPAGTTCFAVRCLAFACSGGLWSHRFSGGSGGKPPSGRSRLSMTGCWRISEFRGARSNRWPTAGFQTAPNRLPLRRRAGQNSPGRCARPPEPWRPKAYRWLRKCTSGTLGIIDRDGRTRLAFGSACNQCRAVAQPAPARRQCARSRTPASERSPLISRQLSAKHGPLPSRILHPESSPRMRSSARAFPRSAAAARRPPCRPPRP